MQYENTGFKGEKNIAASQKIVTKAALQKKKRNNDITIMILNDEVA